MIGHDKIETKLLRLSGRGEGSNPGVDGDHQTNSAFGGFG